MAKKAKKSEKAAWDQAWEVSMSQVKPTLKLECPTCGRKATSRMDPKDFAPFCVKCLDKTLLKLGLKRMIVKGVAEEPEKPIASWNAASAIGKIVTKKARK